MFDTVREEEAAAFGMSTSKECAELLPLPAHDMILTDRTPRRPGALPESSRFGAPGRGHFAQIETLWRYSRVARSSG